MTDVTGAPEQPLHFCPASSFIVLAFVEAVHRLGIRALNNALGQPLVLIAMTNLLCDLKMVMYLTLVRPSVTEN